jgi:predicted secreted protein
MPASNAILGFGALLKIGDGGGPETFTTVAEVRDVNGLNLSMDTHEVTQQTSPGGWKERIAGLLDAGTVTFTVNFLPNDATQGYSTGLLRDMNNRTRRNFKVVFPNAGSTTWSFPAFVTSFQPKAPVNNPFTADVTLQVAGMPTLS